MSEVKVDTQVLVSELYGFIGNSLLRPMTQTSDVGITTDFWNAVPEIPSERFINGRQKLLAYAVRAETLERAKAVEQCAVEYTKLFIGPPSPAAPPWETMNKGGDTAVGFGEATFEMRQLLREAGLELNNENNQYEDHMGIELLYLSVLCERLSETDEQISEFITTHPLAWIEHFRTKIDEAYPEGYFTGLLELTQGLIEWQASNTSAVKK